MRLVSIETFTHDLGATIVRVRSDDGGEGIGQTAPGQADISALILHRQLAPHVLGATVASAQDIAALGERCVQSEYKYEGPHFCRALAGLDTALWDLLGKAQGRSVCELLGGTPRPIDVYGSSMRRDTTPEQEAVRLRTARDAHGFRAFKVKIGRRNGNDEDQWPGRTEALLATVRKELGDETVLYVDANSAYTPKGAIAVGQTLAEHGVVHFEEPCPFQELDWTAEVAAALEVPVAGGEQDSWASQFRRMIRMAVVDIVQPDLCYIGGLTRARAVATLAQDAGLPCTPHASNPSLVAVFTMHLLAAIPNAGRFMEFSIEPSRWDALYAPYLHVTDGKVGFPEGPGWGIEILPAWLEGAERRVSAR